MITLVMMMIRLPLRSKKDVELNSARIYVNQKNSLKFGGDLTFGETGGMRAWDMSSVTVMGDFTQNKGSQHAGHQDGVGLAGENMFTVMGRLHGGR